MGIVPSSGQVFIQFQANGMAGAGYFAGFSGTVGRSNWDMPLSEEGIKTKERRGRWCLMHLIVLPD